MNRFEKVKMKKIYWIGIENPKPDIFDKTLVISIICDKFCHKDEKIFKEEESVEI